MISLNDYLSASGKYPERVNSKELTPEYLKNAENLLERVNALLAELGVKSVKVSSGFRPNSANKAAGGATKSAHLRCMAVDLVDGKNQTLGKTLLKFPDLLRKHGLFMENILYTSSWVHLDCVPRKDRASRTFVP